MYNMNTIEAHGDPILKFCRALQGSDAEFDRMGCGGISKLTFDKYFMQTVERYA
jgi:hypothetical protein